MSANSAESPSNVKRYGTQHAPRRSSTRFSPTSVTITAVIRVRSMTKMCCSLYVTSAGQRASLLSFFCEVSGMNEYYERACEKLKAESKEGKFDRYAAAMKKDVKAALEEFCRQDGEFAQAVVQGGSFSDCMASVAKGVKNGSISDLQAYSRAAEFYFQGSKVRFEMRIELCESEPEETRSDLIIDLSDFL